jgi:hypothetical protein
METTDNDALLLDLIQSVSFDVLARIGDDPDARFQFFKGIVALAQETVRRVEAGRAAGPH